MKVAIIVANCENGVIGLGGKIPWGMNVPADMKYFKNLTVNNYVIMGRKTYDSIGRALPYRDNLIISRNASYEAENGVSVFTSIHNAFEYVRRWETFTGREQQVFIIGGQQINEAALKEGVVDTIYQTIIHQKFEGDAFFHLDNSSEWELSEMKKHLADEKNLFDYSFLTWKKKSIPVRVD